MPAASTPARVGDLPRGARTNTRRLAELHLHGLEGGPRAVARRAMGDRPPSTYGNHCHDTDHKPAPSPGNALPIPARRAVAIGVPRLSDRHRGWDVAGSRVLGVDVASRRHNAMAETDVLDKVPPGAAPSGCGQRFTREQRWCPALREELGTLRTEIATCARMEHRQPASSESAHEARAATVDVSLHNTMAYWNRVNEMFSVSPACSRDADSRSPSTSTARVFALKGRVSRFAAKAVEAIPGADVDGSVLQFGQQLQQWYEHGGTLYERAAQIWQLPVASHAPT